LFFALVFPLAAIKFAASQGSAAANPQPAPHPSAPSVAGEAVTSLRTTIHHVVVDVVAKDKRGRPVRDLTEKDFQVFEKVSWLGRAPEKIAAFRLVDKTAPRKNAEASLGLVRTPPGTYSNLAAVREPDDPLTVVLLDELNTDLYAPDVRQQVLRMFNSIDSAAEKYRVPVAVLLLSNNLHMLQDFTLDMAQVRTAVHEVLSAGPYREIKITSIPGPSLLMQQEFGVAAAESPFPAVRNWDRLSDAGNNDIRIQMTLDAIRATARHLAGYAGRKKLVWLSGSFPFSVLPDLGDNSNAESYRDQIEQVTNALSGARVAVYPLRPGGVWLPDLFASPAASRRQTVTHNEEIGTMEEFAGQTGGSVCADSNDLGYCLKKVLADGYTYYELAYYPPSETWREGLHRIIIRSLRPGVHLSFRHSYYVRADADGVPAGKPERGVPDPELKQATCDDVMTATGIPLAVTPLPTKGSEVARYMVKVLGTSLGNIAPPDPGSTVHLQLEFAACTFNAAGKPLQYGQFPTQIDLDPNEYEQLKKTGFQRVFDFQLKPGVTQLRWLVRDPLSGAFGSVDVPYPAVPATEFVENANWNPSTLSADQAALNFPSDWVNALDPVIQSTPQADTDLANAGVPRLESDAETLGYCQGLGRPGPHADALAKLCEFALSLRSKLPNLICERKTTRFWHTNGYHAHDEVTTQVAYQDGMEYDKDVVVDGKKTNSDGFRRVGSSSSGGEFAADLQAIFSPRSSAEFEYKGETTLGAVPALLFEYTIERQNNHLYYLHARFLRGGEATFYPGYRGQMWIDSSNFQLLRSRRETTEIARGFPMTYASTITDYQNVALGDGSKFPLPATADVTTCSPDEGRECAHNIVHFGNYRRFRATSRIVFGQESQ
jgi:VWFA-related protein